MCKEVCPFIGFLPTATRCEQKKNARRDYRPAMFPLAAPLPIAAIRDRAAL